MLIFCLYILFALSTELNNIDELQTAIVSEIRETIDFKFETLYGNIENIQYTIIKTLSDEIKVAQNLAESNHKILLSLLQQSNKPVKNITSRGTGSIETNPLLMAALSQGNIDPITLMLMNNEKIDPSMLALLGQGNIDPMLLMMMNKNKETDNGNDNTALMMTLMNRNKQAPQSSSGCKKESACKNITRTYPSKQASRQVFSSQEDSSFDPLTFALLNNDKIDPALLMLLMNRKKTDGNPQGGVNLAKSDRTSFNRMSYINPGDQELGSVYGKDLPSTSAAQKSSSGSAYGKGYGNY